MSGSRAKDEVLRFYDPEDVALDGYPLAWHKTIKHLVRELAGHRCVRCGHPYRNGEHKPRGEWSPCDVLCCHNGPGRHRPIHADVRAGTINDGGWVHFDSADIEWFIARGIEIQSRWRILTVHHLDGVKWNCNWWNLAALCQRCHLQIQGKVNMDQVYPFEHSEWFKPYAAGFYAWVYRGWNLTQEETMERIEDLLAIERRI